MQQAYTVRDLGESLFSFNFRNVADFVKREKYDIVGIIFIALNVMAVGFAAAIGSAQSSFPIFFPVFGSSVTFGAAFIIGIIFQFAVVIIYSLWQSFFLNLFDSEVRVDRAMIMVGYAGLWFIPAAILVNFNLLASFMFAILSFHSLVRVTKEYTGSSYSNTFFGIGLASILTGLFSITISLIIAQIII